MATKKNPQVILVPYPAQGHVFPMLKLAHNLSDHGINVTVVNLDFIHRKIITSGDQKQQSHGARIRLISIPDGSCSDIDSGNPIQVTETVEKVLPVQLRELLLMQSEQEDNQQFDWVIADAFLFGVFVVAKELGIKTAALWTASMENFALMLRIPQLVEDETVDENGFLINKESPILISEDIPAWKANELPWSCQPDELQSFFFQHYYTKLSLYSPLFGCVIVNSFHELEPSAFQLFQNYLPIGPITASSTSGGSFWRQDQTCLAWLDKHPPKSVIYVAFGSIANLKQHQFQELASGLEMTGRPFLWVIRTNFVKGSGLEFPDGFLERVSDRGKIVEWANQEEVLSHRSVGCFVSHCGWNSVLDGLWCGVPFLCWPYYVDQFHNKESVCEGWKVGLKLDAEGETGLVTSSEIASKVEQLLNDDTIKGNAIRLRKIAIESVNEGGSSHHNFTSFIDNLCS
ncbi:UDP-glycosyltransferase 83A1 [Linum perenne]